MPTRVRTTTTPARIASGTSQAASFAALPAAGNTIIVYAWGWDSATAASPTATCSDNQGGTYTRDAAVNVNLDRWCAIFRRTNISAPSGTFTVTVTSGTGGGSIVVVAEEVADLQNPPLDGATRAATGTGTAPAAGSLTTGNADDYLAACIASSTAGTSTDVVVPSGFAGRYLEQDGNTYQKGGGADNVVSATGAYDPAWTTLSGPWSALLAAYKGNPLSAPAVRADYSAYPRAFMRPAA